MTFYLCGCLAGGGFGGASMFEDLLGGFFGFPGMGGGGGRSRRRRGEDTFHPLRFVFLHLSVCLLASEASYPAPSPPPPKKKVFVVVVVFLFSHSDFTRICACSLFPA